MKKNTIFNLSAIVVGLSMASLFYSQYEEKKINNTLFNISNKTIKTLINVDKQIVLSLGNGSEINFNLLNRDLGNLNVDNAELKKLGDSNYLDYSLVDLSNIIANVSQILDNRKAIMNMTKTTKEMSNLFIEIELIKSSLENILSDLPKNQTVINTGNLLNNQIKKINEIITSLNNTPQNKQQENLNYLNSIIAYVDNKLGDVNPNSINFQKFIADYSNKLKQLREKYRQVVIEKYDFKTVENIYKNQTNLLKEIENIQENLKPLSDKNEDSLYQFLLMILSSILLLMTFLFINKKAKISKQDYDQLKQFEALKKRTANFQTNLDRVVKLDNGKATIETGVLIDENVFKGSKLSYIVNKTNFLIKGYEGLKSKMDVLSKSSFDLALPVLNLLSSLKKETHNYNLNEISFSSDTIKDVSDLLEDQEIKFDGINGNSQNISYNLGEVLNLLSKTEDGFATNRTYMQNSSKQIKKMGEISQKANDLYEDIRKNISMIELISLNLAIKNSEMDNSNSVSVYAKDLNNIADMLKNLTDSLKQKINEIQINSKDTTDSLEKLTNDIVSNSDMLNKSQNIVKELIKMSDKVLEDGNLAFVDINKMKNNIKLLNEKMETLKEKDAKKTDVITKSEQAFNKIFETIK